MKRKETLEVALENLIYPEDANSNYPAPIGTSNLFVSSASVAGDILSIPNGNDDSTLFESFVLQTGDPSAPILYSSGEQFNYEADGDGYNGSTLYVENEGSAWGTLYNDRQDYYLLSKPLPYSSNHPTLKAVWYGYSAGTNSELVVQDTADHPVEGMFAIQTMIGGVYAETLCDATGMATVTFPAAGTNLFGIYYYTLSSVPNRQASITWDNGGVVMVAPYSPYNLKPLKFSNFPFITSRSDRYRLNSNGLLMTCAMPEIYKGGTIQAGKIVSSIPPSSQDYSTYLYTLKKKYLNKLTDGCYGMWFPSGNEWQMHGNAYHYSKNELASQSVVNMYIINYNSPTGANIPSLDIQLKVDGWIDYTTLDTTIPQIPGIVFTDEWLTAVSAIEALFIFSDNPNHDQIKSVLKKASDFVRSGHPVAQALRTAGSAAIKVLPPLLMAAGLL